MKMRQLSFGNIAAVALAACLFIRLPVSGAEVSGPLSVGNVTPKLTIVSPRQGSRFGKEAIVLDVAIDNFEMAQPEPVHGERSPKPIGHIHIFLDSNPLIATDSRRIMFGTNLNGEFLAPGPHSITVELVHNNHEGFTPRVLQRVDFEVLTEKNLVDVTDNDESLTGTVH